VIADLDMALIAKRKRMMDSVGHYARPELLSLALNDRPATTTQPMHGTPASGTSSNDTGSTRHDHERNPIEPATDDRAAVLRLAAG